jgi:hypothetical protein
MGKRVFDGPFIVEGGKTLMLPVTDAGPIPAEDERIKIQVAGFRTDLSDSHPPVPKIAWMFGFTSKRAQVIERVSVEEISEREPLLVVRDDSPQLRGGDWSRSTDLMDASPQAQPWLYSPAASIFVFKFSIKFKDEAPVVYYQPTWFSGAAKALMIQPPNRGRADRQ